MRWYKRDPDAALAGMIGLTLEERAVYNTVIDLLYSRDGELPTDDNFFSRACECRPQVWRRVRDSLIAKGKLRRRADGKLTANRVEKELQTAGKLIEKMGHLGQISSEKRKHSKDPPPTQRGAQPQPHPHPEKDGGGRDARARGSIPDDVFNLTLEIGKIAGYADASFWPIGWMRAPERVAQMIEHGWRPDIMLAAARGAMARKPDGPPSAVGYFEKPFARAHAEQNRPLPVVVNNSPQPEVINGQSRQSRAAGNPIKRALDEHLARFESEARGDDEVCEAPPRQLSHR